ncbi:MAG: dihydrodipicolinate synthase family protein [Alphaproteobacteria bacterium]|nr:MAG: dihydrodipicolinate synthase family protein [Alphaproteobacteria bacterium]
MQHQPIRGIIAYPVTPFLENGIGIDEAAFRNVLQALLRTDPAAIAILGSAGESAYLRDDEWRRAVELGVDEVAGAVPLIVGIGELTTDAAVAKAKFAEQAGADRLMVIPISYWKLDPAEVFTHFAAIAEATSLPIMIYNNPATSGVDMPPALMVRMVQEIEGVDLIKESSGDIHRMHAIHELSGGTIPFYNGANHLALEALAAGAHGWCTAAPNLLGDRPARLFALVDAGKLEQARTLFYKLLPILRFIVHGGLPTTVKAGLRLQGLEAGDPRRPLLPLSGDRLEELRGLLAAQ